LSAFIAGCGNRGNAPGKVVGPDAKTDPIATALQRLETDSDANTCREVLQAIDSALSANDTRVDTAPQVLQQTGQIARLKPSELETLSAKESALQDPDYLAECLLLRDAARSLELDRYPPAQKAAVAFAWVSRQVYIIEETLPLPLWDRQQDSPRWVIPAPPWWVLQEGSGCALDRAMIFLALLRQVGMDGCLIGPPELADSNSIKLPSNLNEKLTYAPVRAVGVRIDKEILLFDPRLGKPITTDAAAKQVVALAQLRANPEVSSAWLNESKLTADEVKTWQVFLSGPVSSYAPRMAWLQRQMAATNPVILWNDLIALQDRFQKEALAADSLAGLKCGYWNAPDDQLSPTRIQTAYNQEARADGRTFSPLKQNFRQSRYPTAYIPSPQTGGLLLEGKAFELIKMVFDREFAPVFLASGSPRDKLLRGQLSNALAALDDLDRTNSGHRSRIAREGNLEAALKDWSDKASPIFAAIISAERSGDAGALVKANADQENFLKSPASERMVMLVRRNTSLLLSAEAKYLIALVVHERAERIQAQLERAPASELKAEAFRTWENAVDNWRVFLSNFPELNEFYKPRFDHARELQRRAQQALALAKKTN
jgi:hypothetical protein